MTITTARTIGLEYGCTIAAAPGGGYIVRRISDGKRESAADPAEAAAIARRLGSEAQK